MMRSKGTDEQSKLDAPGNHGKPRHDGTTGYGRLTQLLREEILSGRYEDGDRLKVSEIAERFGSSTNPAREALQALEGEGLVTIAPNRGASVRTITEDLVHNVFDIRSLLEPYIARGFSDYATTADLDELAAIQQLCEAAMEADDHPEYHRHNIAFHDFIADRHFNEEALGIMRKHHGWLRVLSRRYRMSQAQMRRASDEHWELIAAMRAGDGDEVAQVIEKHIRDSRQLIVKKMRRDRMSTARRAQLDVR